MKRAGSLILFAVFAAALTTATTTKPHPIQAAPDKKSAKATMARLDQPLAEARSLTKADKARKPLSNRSSLPAANLDIPADPSPPLPMGAAYYRAPNLPPTIGEVCAMIEAEANVRGLSASFFVRLIWQESRFKPAAVSPAGAQGIAQFMPATAADRGLDDPYDPVQAIGHSAQLLMELAETFGNLGLAAAAYNAGPGRVQRWLDGETTLPKETRDYVKIITGVSAESWKALDLERFEPPVFSTDDEPVQDWCRNLPRKPSRVIIEASIGEDVEQETADGVEPGLVKKATISAEEADGIKRASIAHDNVKDKKDKSEGSDKRADAEDKPWRVQLAANYSYNKAQALLTATKKRHGKLLAGYKPVVVKGKEPARGRKPVYAVRIALDTRNAADILCEKLIKEGGACSVARN